MGLQLQMSSPAQDQSESRKYVEEINGRASNDSSIETISEESLEITNDPGKALTPQISGASQPSLARKVTSIGTTGTTDPNFEVDWEDEKDPANPRNWPLAYKAMVIGFLSWNTWVVSVRVLFVTSAGALADRTASTVFYIPLRLPLVSLTLRPSLILPKQ